MTAEDTTTPLVDGLRGVERADAAEAAAVSVAIGAYLRDREVSVAATADEREDWADRRWAFADRLDRARDRGVRIPRHTPTDPWTAADRADRL